jgi:hypothetical protein
MGAWSLIEDGCVHELALELQGESLRVSPAELEGALGWTAKPEGLCRGEVCIPTASRPELVNETGIDLAAFAELVGRPLVLDSGERAAALGASASEQATLLASGVAPDFSLPDLNGELHTLSEHRGKKVLLIAYASW